MRTQVKFGNMEGQYFTQWRIVDLIELLDRIVFLYGEEPLIKVEDVLIHYDAVNDYHMLEFTSNGKAFEIRFYKVFSCSVDGVDLWTGCPRHLTGDFARSIRDRAKS